MIVDERLNIFINSVHREFPKDITALEKKAADEGVPIIRRSTQNLLRFMLMLKKPKRILEVGTAVGFSAILMAKTYEECTIDTIEKYPPRIKEAKENFESFGLCDRISLLTGDAADILKELNGSYDMIFMDAAKGQYIYYLEDIIRLLPAGGVLISDNVLQEGDIIESKYAINRRDRTIHQRMREYLFAVNHDERLESTVLVEGDGLTMSIKK